MLSKPEELQNESDVEQKLVYPLLNLPLPQGLGIPASSIQTKVNIRRYAIGKGKEQKLYYPDYLIVLNGFPIVVIEVKSPEEDLESGYREARLYSYELNAAFPSGVNPVRFVAATNGKQFWAGPIDKATPQFSLKLEELQASSQAFADLQTAISFSSLEEIANRLAESIATKPLRKPTRLVGGTSLRNEEIGHNSFGATIALDHRHLFNPTTHEERAFIAREAYIPSKRRARYVDPIDQIIRAAKPPSISDATLIHDTDKPKELISKLSNARPLEHQILLLIGSVGSGKTTFVDYLREVALPKDLLDGTIWVHINMNNAPISSGLIYDWLVQQIIDGLRAQSVELDHDDLETILKIYSVELTKFKKGIGKLFSPDDPEYRRRLADELAHLQGDPLLTARAYSRYLGAERGRLLVTVLDNCDKRVRDEQLLMFQAAAWLQREF
jgi:hypothetical protein